MALTPGAVINQSGSLTVPRFIRLAIVGHTTESNASIKAMVNVLDWYIQTPLPGGSLAAFLANFQASFETAYLTCLSDTYTLDKYVAKYLDNPANIPVELAVATPGLVNTDRGPSFQAVTIQKPTTVPSRNFRGSMHIGAVPESFTTTDELNGTGTAAYNPLTGVLAGMVTAGVNDGSQTAFPIIISATRSTLLTSPAVISYAPITDFTLQTIVGTMKRRKQKGAA